MSLSSKTELARALFRSTPPDSVTRISGTATADSADGTVTVQLEDGDVIEVGTIGSVSSGDTVTIHVQRGEAQVIASEGWGDAMQAAVDEAQAIAEATGQHFWHDSNGAHVTEVTQEQWAQSQTGHNILVNSLGILLRKALNYIAAWTGSALSFYDGNGNAASNVTASFGSAGAQIGKVGESHIEMDYHSMRLIDKEGDEYFEVEDLRDSTGRASIAEIYTLYFPSAAGGYVTNTVALNLVPVNGSCSFTVTDGGGNDVTSDFSFSVSAGGAVTVTGPSSYVGQTLSMEVAYDTESALAKSYTAGIRNPSMAKGPMSFAEGHTTAAESPYSHAEGNWTEAVGTASHAEGYYTKTTDHFAHAEGYGTVAGYAAHAQNYNTIAQGNSQTALGRYNVADTTSALIIGNGTADNARSNAFTVDWSGNVEAAGDVSGATLSTTGNATVGGSLILGDPAAGHSVDAVISSGTRYFDIYDSLGNPVWRFYMSYAGSLARQEYKNGAWQTARYYRSDIMPGESLGLSGFIATGHLTNSKKSADVTVPFPRTLSSAVSSASVTGTITVRQNNLYLFGSTSSTPRNLSALTVSVLTAGSNGFITLRITGTEQTNAINNNPVTVHFNTLTVTFS